MKAKPLPRRTISVLVSIAMVLMLLMPAPRASLAEDLAAEDDETIVAAPQDEGGESVAQDETDVPSGEISGSEDAAIDAEDDASVGDGEGAEGTDASVDEEASDGTGEVDAAAPSSEDAIVPDEETPLTAQADGSEEKTVSSWSEIKTGVEANATSSFILSGDITASETLTIPANHTVSINLSGRMISTDEGQSTSLFVVEQGASLTITDTSIAATGTLSGSNTTENGGAIRSSGTVTLQGCTITGFGSDQTEKGGALYNEGTMALVNCWIESCTAKSGGAIYNAGTLNMTGGKYQNNTAISDGAGIYNNGTMQAAQCTISNNVASNSGGGIYHGANTSATSTLLLSKCTVTGNRAQWGDGGGLCLMGLGKDGSTPSVTLTASTKITNNQTRGGIGGGIYLRNICVRMEAASVTGNRSDSHGSGIYMDGTLQISGAPVVKQNIMGYNDSTSDNLWLESDKKIDVVGALTSKAHVVVTTDASSVVVTKDYATHNTKDPSAFFAGEENRTAILRDGEVAINENVPYVNEQGTVETCSNYIPVTADLSENVAAGWYVVREDVTLDKVLCLHDDVNLILCDGATLTCAKGIKGEGSVASHTLKVYGQEQGTGTLVSNGQEGIAGIGGGALYLYGGIIKATGGAGAAGIGADAQGSGGKIYLYGGTVEATGGAGAAGIGGSSTHTESAIYIYKTTVTATGGTGGAGIGAGKGLDAQALLYIEDATVTATGGAGAAGIGGGSGGMKKTESYFKGGTVTARGGEGAAGIGCGKGASTYGSSWEASWFAGATVTAISGGSGASAIGYGAGGYLTGDELFINIDRSEEEKKVSDSLSVSALDYMVTAGSAEDTATKVSGADRKTACATKAFARLEPCDHQDMVVTSYEDGTSKIACPYCTHAGDACQVTLDAGDGTGTAEPAYVAVGDTYITPREVASFTAPTGRVFTGWALGEDTYAPGEGVKVSGDITLTAQWTMTWKGLQEVINAAKDGRSRSIRLLNDVVAESDDTALSIPAGKKISINLNGHALNRNLGSAASPVESGSVVVVEGELTIRDSAGGGAVTGGCSPTGGGVFVTGGKLTVTGGSIKGNLAADGGGVYVDSGTCELNDGYVEDNTAQSSGGGVFVKDGTVTMEYASIRDNTAASGGGVIVAGGSFALGRGTVEGNAANAKGGGILVQSGAEFQLGAAPTIKDNKARSATSNVYLEDAKIVVTDNVTVQTPISISTSATPTADAPITLTSGLSGKGVAESIFTSEVSGAIVGNDAQGEAVLGSAAVVTFDPDDGEGEMDPQTVVVGSTFELPACTFEAPHGRVFVGWFVDNGEEPKSKGAIITVSGDTVLRACWESAYPVWVGGTQVTAYNRYDVLNDGKVSYDGETSTLTITGVEGFSGDHSGAYVYAEGDLTITGSGKLVAAEEAKEASYGIDVSDGSLTLNGDFTVAGEVYGIHVSNGSATLDGNVTIEGKNSFGISIHGEGDVNINGGTVKVTSQNNRYGISTNNLIVTNDITSFEAMSNFSTSPYAINATESIQIGNRLYIETPTDGKIMAHYGRYLVCDADGNPAGHAVIKPKPAPAFKTQSLVLSGKIGVNFFVDMSMLDEEVRKASYMEFSVSGKGGTTTTVPFDEEFTNETGEYYGFTCYVNSIQMADTITATLHYRDDESITKDYSVMQYVKDFEAAKSSGNYSTQMVDLVEALATYGHYMQPYLSSVRGWSIGTDYAEMTLSYPMLYDSDAVADRISYQGASCDLGTSDIESASYMLHLDTDTAIYLNFTPKSGYKGSVSATLDGNEVAVTKRNGRYRVIVGDIAAHELGDTHTVVLTTDSGSATVQASVLSYARSVLNNQESTTWAARGMTSLYNYWMAAKRYRSSQAVV